MCYVLLFKGIIIKLNERDIFVKRKYEIKKIYIINGININR